MITLNDNYLLNICVYLVLHEQYLLESSKWPCERGFSKCTLWTRNSRFKDIRYQARVP